MMASVSPLASPALQGAMSPALPLGAVAPPAPPSGASFDDMVADGLHAVDGKIAKADALVQSLALGDPVPIHQVGIALEEARLAVEIAMQVRARIVETYRDFMTMQL